MRKGTALLATALVILTTGMRVSPGEIKSLKGLKDLTVFVGVNLEHKGLGKAVRKLAEARLRQAGLTVGDNPFVQPLIVSVTGKKSLEVEGLWNVEAGVLLQDTSGADMWISFHNFPVDEDKLEYWTLRVIEYCVDEFINDWLAANSTE